MKKKLLQEIEYLRCENDLLKKFHALVQAEEQAKSASHNGIKAQV
jgi:hypothetical protein